MDASTKSETPCGSGFSRPEQSRKAQVSIATSAMSIGGANLEVESHGGIPDSFDLLIDAENGKHHLSCRLA